MTCLLRRSVGAELRKYGLRYEDVIVVTPDVDTAIRRMEVEDPAAVELRNKRLKRAMDLGLKHTYLPAEMQAAHDPWADSMTQYIAQAKQERRDACLGAQQQQQDLPPHQQHALSRGGVAVITARIPISADRRYRRPSRARRPRARRPCTGVTFSASRAWARSTRPAPPRRRASGALLAARSRTYGSGW